MPKFFKPWENWQRLVTRPKNAASKTNLNPQIHHSKKKNKNFAPVEESLKWWKDSVGGARRLLQCCWIGGGGDCWSLTAEDRTAGNGKQRSKEERGEQKEKLRWGALYFSGTLTSDTGRAENWAWNPNSLKIPSMKFWGCGWIGGWRGISKGFWEGVVREREGLLGVGERESSDEGEVEAFWRDRRVFF